MRLYAESRGETGSGTCATERGARGWGGKKPCDEQQEQFSEEMAIRLTRGDNLPAAESISSMDSFEQSASKTVRSSSKDLRVAKAA